MAMRFYVSTANAPFFVENVMGYGESIPTTGSHKVGDFIISSTQTDGVFGWVCTVAGTPGEWSEIGSGGGGGSETALKLEAIENVVNVRTTNKVLIGINEYDPDRDILEVHYNGTKLSEGTHFTLNKIEKSISKISGTWNPENLPDYKMDFRVVKATVGKGTLKKITKTIKFSEPKTEVVIGIPEFVYSSDVLDIHLNGIKLMDGVDFRYVAGDNKIVKIDDSEPWNMYGVNNQIMVVDVLKNTANQDMTGFNLVDGSVTTNKLSKDVRDLMNDANNNIGKLSSLQTANKTNLVSAINELFQSANNGKSTIATAIGSPLSSSDSFSAMGNKIDIITERFRNKLMNSNVELTGKEKYNELVEKIESTGILPKQPTWVKNIMYQTSKQTAVNRANTPITYLDRIIYDTCGYDTQGEKYDILTNTWTTIANPTKRHSEHDANVINGYIYVFGGKESISASTLCEKYDHNSNTWTSVAPMPISAHSYINYSRGDVLGNKYYRLGFYGGGEGLGYSTRALIYDALTNTWENKTNLVNGNSSAVVFVMRGELYTAHSNMIYKYDESANSLTHVYTIPNEIGAGSNPSGFVVFKDELYNVKYNRISKITESGVWSPSIIYSVDYISITAARAIPTTSDDFIFFVTNGSETGTRRNLTVVNVLE